MQGSLSVFLAPLHLTKTSSARRKATQKQTHLEPPVQMYGIFFAPFYNSPEVLSTSSLQIELKRNAFVVITDSNIINEILAHGNNINEILSQNNYRDGQNMSFVFMKYVKKIYVIDFAKICHFNARICHLKS